MFNNVAAVYPCRVKRNQMRQLHLEMGGWVGEKKTPSKCFANELIASRPRKRELLLHSQGVLPLHWGQMSITNPTIKKKKESVNSSKNMGTRLFHPAGDTTGGGAGSAERGSGPEKQQAGSGGLRARPALLPPPTSQNDPDPAAPSPSPGPFPSPLGLRLKQNITTTTTTPSERGKSLLVLR